MTKEEIKNRYKNKIFSRLIRESCNTKKSPEKITEHFDRILKHLNFILNEKAT